MIETNLRRSSTMFSVAPRHGLDPVKRRIIFGPIRPLDADMSWWDRIFRS